MCSSVLKIFKTFLADVHSFPALKLETTNIVKYNLHDKVFFTMVYAKIEPGTYF